MSIEDRVYPFLKHYINAPQLAKSLMGHTYACLPPAWRYGRHYHQFLEEVERRGDSAWCAQRASEKLRDTLLWAAETVPAYAKVKAQLRKDHSPQEWLQAFPLLHKREVKADTNQFLSHSIPAHSRLAMHTGGSTSVPMRLYVQKYVSRSKDFAYNTAFDRLAGVGAKDVIVAARGRSVPGSHNADGPIWLWDPIKRYLQLSNNHLGPEHMPRYLEAMRQFKPTFLHIYPSALEPLARWLDAHPAPDVTQGIRCIQLFSESIFDYQLDFFERVFGCPVIMDYGHSERAVKAVSRINDRRYFFWPLYGHVELVDQQGQVITQPGQVGEIVATGFDNQVMPLVRYRTGDMACWSAQSNQTQPGFQVVDRIEGRLQEFLVCADQRLVSITSMCAAHFEVLVTADCMQFEQFRPGQAVLKIVSPTEISAQAKVLIEDGIRNKTLGGLQVQVQRVAELPRTSSGKHRLLVQHLDVSNLSDRHAVPVM
jgi:phenylacetate-CoA ligase